MRTGRGKVSGVGIIKGTIRALLKIPENSSFDVHELPLDALMDIRTIGSARAHMQIGLINLAYNIKCVAMLIRKKHSGFCRVIAPAAG